jgi:protein TonB
LDIADDPVTQPRPVPATSFVERVRAPAGRRLSGFVLTLLVEALMLLMILSLGTEKRAGREDGRTTVVNIDAEEVAEEEAPEPRPEPERRPEERPATQRPAPEEPRPPQPPAPVAPPTELTVQPSPVPSPPAAAMPRSNARPAPPNGQVYGPVDNRSPAMRDTERVGTAPNGEPLYAAAWYREPEDRMLHDYLSTARGPGWGLIACRTAPDYRVEDCVGLGEYPEGSQIMRAVLAAAWEFRVRPPRLGGRPLVGAWVRIRIDYGTGR